MAARRRGVWPQNPVRRRPHRRVSALSLLERNNIKTIYIMKHLTKKLMAWLWLPLASAAALSSCSMMHEDRGDCPTGLYLGFRYDYNLERADMFADHVGAVDVYVFDADGHYVTTLSDANHGAVRPLARPGYLMHAELAPGKYKFIALAGSTDYASQMEAGRAHFVRTEPGKGDAMETLRVRLETDGRAEAAVRVDNHGQPLDTLWHGMETELVEVFAERPTYHTISLVRDTKKINVTLRELDDPSAMDVANYDMTITDRNAALRWDNSLDESQTVIYTPHATWNTEDRTPANDANGERAGGIGRMAHADFMTSRIMLHADPADDGIMSITNRLTGIEVVRVNLPDLLSRLRTSEEIYRYSAQEFLDRGYDYRLDFYLKGDRLAYVNISISILGWSKRVQFEDL